MGSVCATCGYTAMVHENALSRYECDTLYLLVECTTVFDMITSTDHTSNCPGNTAKNPIAPLENTKCNTGLIPGSTPS